MSETSPALPGFDWHVIEPAERAELAHDWNLFLPAPPHSLDAAAVFVASLAFYRDYRLVRVDAAEGRGASADGQLASADGQATSPAGSGGPSAYFLHAPGDLRPLDASARAIDRVNEVAPLALDSGSVVRYLLLRLAFTLSTQAVGPAGQRGALLLAASPASGAEPVIHAAPANDLARPPGALIDDAWRVALTLRLPGLAEAQPDGLPGGPAVRLEAVVTASGTSTVVRIEALPASPSTAQTSPALDRQAPVSAQTCARIRPGPAWLVWQPPDEALRAELVRLFGAWKGDLQRASLRFAPLAFYRHYRLLEIAEPGPSGWQRSYALVAPFAPGLEEPVIALDGTSPPIHRVNAIPDEFQPTDDAIDPYLAFFCWAVQGDEGSFLVPRTLRGLPWRRAPEAGLMAVLEKDFVWGFQPVSAEEEAARGLRPRVPGEQRRRAVLAYSNALFDAWLAVMPDGMVDMIDDAPRMADLPIRGERFGSPRLGIPKRYQALGHHLLRHRALDMVALFPGAPGVEDAPVAESRLVVSAEEFVRRLVCEESVEDLEVADARVVWQPDAAPDERPRVARNCVLRHGLALQSTSSRAPLRLVACSIEGGLSARGAQLTGPLEFVQCRFYAPESDSGQIAIDLRNASLDGEVEFFACVCHGRIEGSSLRASRHFRLRGCSVVRPGSHPQPVRVEDFERLAASPSGFQAESLGGAAAVTLLQARIAGELEISAAGDESTPRIGGATALDIEPDAIASVIRGSLDLSAIEAGSLYMAGTWVSGIVMLNSARIAGALSLCVPPDTPLHRGSHFACTGWLDLASAHIGGQADLRMAHIGGTLQIYQCEIDNNLILSGARIAGDLNAAFATVHAFVMAFASPDWLMQGTSHLSVGGKFELSGANMRFVELRGIEIGGELRIHSSTFSSLRILPAIRRVGTDTDGSGQFWIAPNRVRSLSIYAVSTDSDLSLVDLRTEAPPLAERARTGQPTGLLLNHCTVGGSLTLSMSRPQANLSDRFSAGNGTLAWQRPDAASALPDAAAVRTAALGPAIPSQADILTEVWGDLDLRANQIAGGLDLRNVRVEGQILLNDTRVGLDLQLGADYEIDGGRYTRLATECAHLDLEKLECGGDVDLTGLRIAKVIEAGGEPPATLRHIAVQRLGTLAGRGMSVKGELLFAPREPRKRRDEPSQPAAGAAPAYLAQVNGEVDLTGASAGHLVLSGDSLGPDCRLVRLEGSEFNRFELIDPPPDKPVDLSGMSTGRWLFSNDSSCDVAPIEIVERVLRNMPTLDRKAWLDVETNLRNEGREAEANRIYLAMRRTARARREAGGGNAALAAGQSLSGRLLSLLERAWDHLHDFATRYGTEVRRPMLPALLLLPLSLWIFSDPRNVTASTDLLQVIGNERIAVAGASPSSPAGQPEWLAVSPEALGVPWSLTDALALTVRYQVPIIGVLTHDRWEASPRPLPVIGASAENYAFWLELYHWIAWPLFLIGAAAGAFRGRR